MAGDSFTTDNVIVRNNYASGLSGYGIHVYDERKSYSDPLRSISNITIEGNYISESQLRGGIVVAAGPETKISGVVIKNNVVVENATYGIGVYYSGEGVDDIKIYNNPVYPSNVF